MPSTKDDIAVYPADSDAFAGLTATSLSYNVARTVIDCFTLGLLQAEKSWIKDDHIFKHFSGDSKFCSIDLYA